MKIQKKKNKKEEEKNSNSNININNGNIYKDKIEDEKYKGQFEVYSDVFPRLKRVDKNKNKELTDISIYKPIDKEKEKEKKAGRIIGSNTLIEIPDTHYNLRLELIIVVLLWKKLKSSITMTIMKIWIN